MKQIVNELMKEDEVPSFRARREALNERHAVIMTRVKSLKDIIEQIKSRRA